MSIWDYFSGNASPEQTASLTGFASAINGALGDGRRPVGLGQILSAGAQGMQQGRDQYGEQQQQQAIQALKLRAMQGDVEAQDRLQQEQMALQQAAQSAVGPDGQFNQEQFLRTLRSTNALKAIELEQKMAKAGPEFDTKPQTGLGPDGKPFQYLIAKNGEMKRLDGVLPRDELKLANLGGKDVAYNPFALQDGQSFQRTATPDALLSASTARQGQIMTDARAREANANSRGLMNEERQLRIDALRGKADDKKLAKEGTAANLRTQVSIIDKALDHPGRATATGLSSTLDPRNYTPGTDATDFRVVADQLSGGAFLQAFESLKGAGQITEIEGQKATAAIARLNRAQSDGEYETALYDLRDVINSGIKRSGAEPAPDRPRGGARTAPASPKAAVQASPAAASIPPGAANMLKMNPRLREQFDAKYGAGAAASVLGK